jgi:DNA-binding transcriptional regulator YiaG
LVADSLEAEWNSKLRALTETQQERERQRQQDRQVVSDEQRSAILALAADFPRLWRDPNTPDRERKRMTRLLVEDVTLIRTENIVLHIRFKGGATKILTVPSPLNAWQQRATSPEVIREIDRLLDHNTDSQIASMLNERDMRSGEGKAFTSRTVARVRKQYGLTPRYDRLRKAGMLTIEEMAELLGITPSCVRTWHRYGLLRGHAYTDKNDCLYEHPGDNPPRKAQGLKLAERRPENEVSSTSTNEVQCEA